MITGPELQALRLSYGFTQKEVGALIPGDLTMRRMRRGRTITRPRFYSQTGISLIETGVSPVPKGFVMRYRQALKTLNKARRGQE